MNKKLLRSSSNRMIAGVCGGLADFFDLDPTLVRVAYIMLSVFTVFSGVFVYILLCIVIPSDRFK